MRFGDEVNGHQAAERVFALLGEVDGAFDRFVECGRDDFEAADLGGGRTGSRPFLVEADLGFRAGADAICDTRVDGHPLGQSDDSLLEIGGGDRFGVVALRQIDLDVKPGGTVGPLDGGLSGEGRFEWDEVTVGVPRRRPPLADRKWVARGEVGDCRAFVEDARVRPRIGTHVHCRPYPSGGAGGGGADHGPFRVGGRAFCREVESFGACPLVVVVGAGGSAPEGHFAADYGHALGGVWNHDGGAIVVSGFDLAVEGDDGAKDVEGEAGGHRSRADHVVDGEPGEGGPDPGRVGADFDHADLRLGGAKRPRSERAQHVGELGEGAGGGHGWVDYEARREHDFDVLERLDRPAICFQGGGVESRCEVDEGGVLVRMATGLGEGGAEEIGEGRGVEGLDAKGRGIGGDFGRFRRHG